MPRRFFFRTDARDRLSDRLAVVDAGDGEFIAAAETFTVLISGFAGYVWMAILVAIVDVGAAVVVEVFAGTLDAVVKALAGNVTELVGRGVPGTFHNRRGHGRPTVHEVRHGEFITATEAFAIFLPCTGR